MASVTDHIRRDAEDVLRHEIAVALNQYKRRVYEMGKAHIAEAIEEATRDGEAVDGIAIGRAAANQAIPSYIGTTSPQPAIEATGGA